MPRDPNAADPARTLALLWRQYTRTGRSGLTLDGIVTTAIHLADDEGLEQLTMRRLAEQLTVGTMTLYTHVPGRAELLALMVDLAYADLYPTGEPPPAPAWRDGLRAVAERNWALLLLHPWLLDLNLSRPSLGPHGLLKYERELAPLDGLGLADTEMDAVLTLLLTHVEGCARLQQQVRRNQQDSGRSDEEWWAQSAPLLSQVFDARRFPLAARVGTAAGEAHQGPSNPRHAFTFGLERILDGVQVLLSVRQDAAPPSD